MNAVAGSWGALAISRPPPEARHPNSRRSRNRFPGRRKPDHPPDTRKDQDMTNSSPEELIPFLAHEHPLVRNYTGRLLGLDSDERVEQYLKSILTQGTARQRRAVVQAMGHLADDWTLQPLGSALRDADPAVRAEAARVLGRRGDRTAVPELIALLSDPDDGVRSEALRSLSSLRDPRAIPALTLALQSPDASLRRCAAEALAALDAREAVPPSCRWWPTRTAASRTSRRRPWAGGGFRRRRNLSWRLCPARRRQRRWQFAGPWVNCVIRSAIPALIEMLKGWRTASQTAAAHALGQIGDRSAVDVLCQTLTEKWDPELRVATVRALERLGDTAAVPHLIAAMGQADGEDDDFRHFRGNRAAPGRAAAVQALGTLGAADAVDPLINAVHDSSDLVRLEAVRTLSLLGAPRSLPHLLAARHDSEPHVAEAATDALIALDPDLLESTLLELFDYSSLADRDNAARGLARLGSAAALSRLVAALGEPDRDVRMAATCALGHTGNPDVVDPLISALEDPEFLVRREALLALAEIGDPRAEPHLLDRREDPDWRIRDAVARWFRSHREGQPADYSPPA